MDSSAAPSLLPILRSRQQGLILFHLLGNPDREMSLTELSGTLDVPYASVHREVERAIAAGIASSRSVGRTRLISANTQSPYFESLADLLTKAFGPTAVLGGLLEGVNGIELALIFGSWAAAYSGAKTERPVGDIDVLVIGDPDRDALYAAAAEAERILGRDVQVTIRASGWLDEGSGAFHASVTSGDRVVIPINRAETASPGPSPAALSLQ